MKFLPTLITFAVAAIATSAFANPTISIPVFPLLIVFTVFWILAYIFGFTHNGQK
jgi:uncharacterized membrane protein (DUF485 family)